MQKNTHIKQEPNYTVYQIMACFLNVRFFFKKKGST